MHVLFLTQKFPYPLKDGGAIATSQIINGISKLARKVFMLSFNTVKHFIEEEQIPKEYIGNYKFKLINIDTTPKKTGGILNLLFSNKPYNLQLFKSNTFQKELIELLNRIQFDMVQIEGLYMLQYIPVIRKYSNAKIAFRPHNLEHQIWEQLARNQNVGLKRVYFKLLSNRILNFEKTMLNSYDLILPISPEDASMYQTIGNIKPLKIIPTGFDLSKDKKPNTKNSEHTLFFIGSLEWRPNQQGLIWFMDYCWPKINRILPQLEFHIAGRNSPNWLRKRCSLPGIIWHGEVESSCAFMEDKSIMVAPLLSGSGMRVKIIEAFTLSKVVVATTAAAKGTGAIDGEHILVADNHITFVDKLLLLIENREFYNNLAQKAFAYSKDNFNNEKISEELYQFYLSNL